MKPITLDLFTQYSFLSNLQYSSTDSKILFAETKSDLEKNDYTQRLHCIDMDTSTITPFTDWKKRTSSYMMKDGTVLLVDNDEEDKTIHTQFKVLRISDGSEVECFKLPCSVGSIQDFNEEYYLASITINKAYPNYHHMSLEERQAIEKQKQDNEDYVVFDEYPFFFNGAGIINGDRNTLVLVNKKTLEIMDLVTPLIDVESFDVDGKDIIYSGVYFSDVKGKWSWVWKVNTKTLETTVLYDEVMQINRVFVLDHKVIVNGTFAKEYGAMEAGKFYELKDQQMYLVCDNEYSLYNSVGTDCRYGRNKNFYKKDNKAYFITSDQSRSVILEFDGETLSKRVDFEGTCDDMVITDQGIYSIVMKGQALQEVAKVEGACVEVLSSFNTAILEDKYVAVPQKVTVSKETPITGWVLLPKDYDPSKKYAAILDIHGGPKTAYGEIFYHEMQHWASLGYFVMFCNPRGSDGRGNRFADLRRNFGKIDYEDIMDFVDEVLKQYPCIDAERLGVTGGSYGGYMTNWIIGQTQRFKAAATQRSISNWITEVCASDYGIDFPIEQEFDDLYNCQEELWDMSPLKYANNATTPTLFIHSIEDYRCPIPEAIQLFTVLKCRGIKTKLVAFKGENHELSRSGKPTHRIRRLSEITQWMDKHLN